MASGVWWDVAGTFWVVMGRSGALWGYVGRCWVVWGAVKPFGALSVCVGRSGSLWDRVGCLGGCVERSLLCEAVKHFASRECDRLVRDIGSNSPT